MSRQSKRIREIAEKVDVETLYSLEKAIEVLQGCPKVKFDQSLDVSFKLGVDPRKSDQSVRGTVALPNGTGKEVKILVFTKGDKVKEALESGADYAGCDELIEKVKGGWTDFDVVIATPDMMREVGKLGKVLGPRGLMPTPKAGTVTTQIADAVAKIKAGQIEYKIDRSGVVNNAAGKLSFSSGQLVENVRALIQAVSKAKPASVKGVYIRGMVLSSTMGPGLKIDSREYAAT